MHTSTEANSRSGRLKRDSKKLVSSLANDARQDDLLGSRLLWSALALALLFHGGLLFSQSFVRTYDALIHIFFGAHYAEHWFDPWEPRWYTGFFTISYPPLSHQLIALLSKIFDLKTAFVIVQLAAILNTTVGVYRFSKLFASPRAAGYASLALVLSSSIAETVHAFGQLPTTVSIGFLLNAIPFAWRYVRKGDLANLLKALAFVSATTAGHHITTIFGSAFFVVPTLFIAWLEGFRSPRPLELLDKSKAKGWKRLLHRAAPRTYRAALFLGLTGISVILVVFPYVYWNKTDPILQVSIPHASRDSFIKNTSAGLMFWLIPWASSIVFLPYALYKGFSSWRWPIAASLFLLFVLGTGGTTPIPRLLLRSSFDLLTLDRFTFWATMLILPFVGKAIESVLHGRWRLWFDANLGRHMRLGLAGAVVASSILLAVGVANLTRLRKFQPEPIEIQPIVNFIEKDQHWRYRYLTLGFGDQMAWLSANTRALTPDGNYHSARRLVEMTTTPVERLDGAKYVGVPGLGSLEQFVTMPEKFNLKFVFSNDAFYDPLLFFSGWHKVNRLENGIVVWEREDIPPLPERIGRKSLPLYLQLMWGILPPLAFLVALFSLLLPIRAPRIAFWQRLGIGQVLLEWLREDALAPDLERAKPWWRRFVPQLEEVLNFETRTRVARAVRAFGVVVIFGLFAAFVWKITHPKVTPEATVLEYWDRVDFKRFRDAYDLIVPKEGLVIDRFMLDLSVQGGLRSGYAKLDRIEPKLVALEPTRALVRTKLTWVTSLDRLTEFSTQELELTAQGWKILVYPLSKTRPRERFAEDAGVDYYQAPRRLTTGATSSSDVLDRPRLAVGTSRLVSHVVNVEIPAVRPGAPVVIVKKRIFSLVGELQNIDARPADVTVTVILRDRDGLELRRNNVGTVMMHKLLPGERTPFRVDFLGTDAPTRLEDVTDYEMYAKAVVTGRDLDRPLVAWTQAVPGQIKATLSNVGTLEASIPHAIISLYDVKGLAWVEERYALESISPREFETLSLPDQLPRGYRFEFEHQPKADESKVFDSAKLSRGSVVTAPLKEPGLTRYRVQLQTFEANP